MKFNVSRLYDVETAKASLNITVTYLCKITDYENQDDLLALIPEEDKEKVKQFHKAWKQLNEATLGDERVFKQKVKQLFSDHEDAVRSAEFAMQEDAADRKLQKATTKARLAKMKRELRDAKRARVQEKSKYKQLMEKITAVEKALEEPASISTAEDAVADIKEIVESCKAALDKIF